MSEHKRAAADQVHPHLTSQGEVRQMPLPESLGSERVHPHKGFTPHQSHDQPHVVPPQPGYRPPTSATPSNVQEITRGLLDLKFNHLISLRLVPILYTVSLVLSGIALVGALLFSLVVLVYNPFLGVMMLISLPVISLLYLFCLRITCELITIGFKTHYYLQSNPLK